MPKIPGPTRQPDTLCQNLSYIVLAPALHIGFPGNFGTREAAIYRDRPQCNASVTVFHLILGQPKAMLLATATTTFLGEGHVCMRLRIRELEGWLRNAGCKLRGVVPPLTLLPGRPRVVGCLRPPLTGSSSMVLAAYQQHCSSGLLASQRDLQKLRRRMVQSKTKSYLELCCTLETLYMAGLGNHGLSASGCW